MEIRGLLVDTFLSKSINVAHSLARKAEECEKLGESKNAIECHGKAASIMDEILKEEGIDFQVTLSLKLQCKYHENRIKFLTAVDDFEVNINKYMYQCINAYYAVKVTSAHRLSIRLTILKVDPDGNL